jgi:hypothetical protein
MIRDSHRRCEISKGVSMNNLKQTLMTHPALTDLELLLAIPEFKVSLPGGRAASQNDFFVLARSPDGLVVT